MTQGNTAAVQEDGVYDSDFVKEMVKQMRALDTYGTYDKWPAARVLEPYILTKERKQEIPVVGDPDEITMSRVRAFYNTIAVLIEKECGLMAVPLVNLTHEGFGRALITVGKLVVMDRTLRDVHRFGFAGIGQMKDEADKILSIAINLIGSHSDVAGL